MRFAHYLACLVLIALTLRCTTRSQREETTRPISFELKRFAASLPGGCADSSSCVSVEVSYPEFSGWDSLYTQRLAAIIDTSLMHHDESARGKSMRRQADDFVKAYQEVKAEIPDLNENWYYKAIITPQIYADSMVSLAVHEEYYTGGAHGGSTVHFINVRPETGHVVTLDDVLKPGYKEPLTNLGEKLFREKNNIPPTASLLENNFMFPDDKFKLPVNYGFKAEGIVFYYDSYAIASYAEGPTELTIPYSMLANWLQSAS